MEFILLVLAGPGGMGKIVGKNVFKCIRRLWFAIWEIPEGVP
jgi:hypothetical protein